VNRKETLGLRCKRQFRFSSEAVSLPVSACRQHPARNETGQKSTIADRRNSKLHLPSPDASRFDVSINKNSRSKIGDFALA
jgi:hypothetical protein